MQLTKQELETTILFNEAEDEAVIETPNKKLQRILDAICEEKCSVSDKYGFKVYHISKKLINIRKPNKLTEEDRLRRSERMKELRSNTND